MLRHVAGADATVATVGADRRRAFALAAATTTVNGGASPPPREALLWRDRSVEPDDLRELSERSGLKVGVAGHSLRALDAELDAQALNGDSARLTPEAFVPAVAVATCGTTAGRAHTVDLLHSRLAPPPAQRISRRTAIVGGAVLLGVAILAMLYVAVHQREAEAAILEQQLADMKPDVDAAAARIARVRYGREYLAERSPVLECLREITLAFRPNEPIWTTSFTYRGDTGKGQLQGRAANQEAILALRDRLTANGRFADVQDLDMRDSAGNAEGVAFSFTFTFVGDDDLVQR
jgi:hypothetical protein